MRPTRTPTSLLFDGASALRAPLVLVVDDVEDNRAVTAEYLRFLGYRVIEAEDGMRALELALEQGPDVIVMDLALPRMDGYKTTRRLKELAATNAIPILALSAASTRESRNDALAAGCTLYLAKPCEPEHLAHCVEECLSLPLATDDDDGQR